MTKRRLSSDTSLAVKAINRAALVTVPVVGPIITELMGLWGRVQAAPAGRLG